MFGIKPKAEIVTPPPEFPHAIGHIWNWLREILRGIQGNGFSYPVVTWEALDAWARLTGQEIAPREARTIIMLGTLHANIMSEKPKPDAGKG